MPVIFSATLIIGAKLGLALEKSAEWVAWRQPFLQPGEADSMAGEDSAAPLWGEEGLAPRQIPKWTPCWRHGVLGTRGLKQATPVLRGTEVNMAYTQRTPSQSEHDSSLLATTQGFANGRLPYQSEPGPHLLIFPPIRAFTLPLAHQFPCQAEPTF